MALAKVASDVKAADIKVLFVKPLVYWTRFFIIATAFSRPQIDAIGYDLSSSFMIFVCLGGILFLFVYFYEFYFLCYGLKQCLK